MLVYLIELVFLILVNKTGFINFGFSILSVGKGENDKLGVVFLILIVDKGDFVINLVEYKENS